MSELFDYLASHGSTLPEETVFVEQWGQNVTLRGWSSAERDAFEEENLKRAQAKAGNGSRPGRRATQLQADLANFRARTVIRTIVENGQRIVPTSEQEDRLGQEPAVVIDRLYAIAQRLHGMSDQDVEDLLKNSGAPTEGAEPSSVSLPSSDAPSVN